MAPDVHANFAISTVATAPSPATSGTSLVVAAAEGSRFPTVPFNATVWPAAATPTPANAEIVRVTNVSTDTLTITRTQESSSARTVVVGDQIMASITKKTLVDAETTVFSYVEFTSNVTISATSAATANTVVTAASVTLDGSTMICVEFYAPTLTTTSTLLLSLWQDSTDLGLVALISGTTEAPALVRRFLTPSAGAYVYSIRGYRSSANGTVKGSTGGSDTFLAGYVRVTAGA